MLYVLRSPFRAFFHSARGGVVSFGSFGSGSFGSDSFASRSAVSLSLFVCALICAIFSAGAFAQVRVSEWQTYSSLLNVRATATDKAGNLWAATSGGVFSYNLQTRDTQEFRNINALFGIDITAIAVHPESGAIYAGGFNGALNIFDGANWRVVTDIFTANIARKQINDFFFQGSRVFIAGDFGLTIFDAERGVFIETAQRFGSLQPGLAVKRFTLAGGRLWLATEGGVVSAALGLPSYANPASWTIHPFAGGGGNPVVAVVEHGGVMHAAEGRNLWQMANNQFSSVAKTYFEPLRSLASAQGRLFAATENFLWDFAAQDALTQTPRPMNSLTVVDSAGAPRLSVNSRQGFSLWTSPASSFVRLNSPVDNRFRSISIDAKGGLWCVSGSNQPAAIPNDGSATGISVLRDSIWRIFTAETHPEMRVNTYYQIDAQPNGTVWAASYGGGALLIEPDSAFRLSNFNSQNAPIPPTVGDTFSVLGQAQTDSRTGIVWMPNFQVGGDSIVLGRTPQGRFVKFARSLNEKRYHFLAIDRSGTKWFATWRGAQILAFNERNTPDNTNDDVWFTVDAVNEGQSCIAVDNNDRIWFGTPRAAYSIVNPGFVLNQVSGQRLIIDQPRKLADQTYNAVAVDALNYKWFGTTNGVFVYDSERDTVLARFTAENSPLASNNVLSLAIDNNTGKVYIGTDNGLSVASTLSIRPNASFETLRCYPQPFVPSQDQELVIDGLAAGSQVKISTIDGLLVRSFSATNSRTLVWDGLDDNNRAVQSGVYLISAYSDAAGANAVIKAMVIQR